MFINLQKPSLEQKATFFRLLAVSQKAGLGIRASIHSLQQGETHKGMLMILEDMILQLTEGSSLADAMQFHPHFFNPDEIELIRATEITGNMAQTLEDVADSLEENQEINQKIKKALTYPTIVIVFAIVAVVVILVFVMPTIIEMYGDIELPAITQFMLNTSDFLQAYGIYLGLAIFGLVMLYNFAYSNLLSFKIVIDAFLLKVPLVKEVIRIFYMSRFTSLLAQFYGAGVSPIVSFKLLASIFDNFSYKRKMIEIRNSINAGFSIYESMEGSDLFDPILIQIINVGENTGSLTEVLKKISIYYTFSLKAAIDSLMSIIEPALMALVSCVVGALLGAIYLPMADMVNVIGA
ncbi:MAG: type II secretion system F family protein [Candidatus Absconditabacteria bacterium]|nr:type II secretion system F family protein [Candidatus Absconditabacteria bacterium]